MSVPETIELDSSIASGIELVSSDLDKSVILDSFIDLSNINLNSQILIAAVDLVSNLLPVFTLRCVMTDKNLDLESLFKRNVLVESAVDEKKISLESFIS